MRLVPALWTLFFAASVVSTVGFQKADDGVTLRLALEPGQQLNYNVSSTTETWMGGRNQISKSEMRQVYDVLSKKEEGALVEFKIKDFRLLDRRVPINEAKRLTAQAERSRMEFVVDEFGMPVSTKSFDEAEKTSGFYGLAIQNGLMGFGFPKEPVKVGTEWQGSVDLGEMLNHTTQDVKVLSQETKFPITYKVMKIETDGDVKVVYIGTKIEAKVSIETQRGPVELQLFNTGVAEIDASNGIVRASRSAGKSVNYHEELGLLNQQVKFEMVRQKEGS